MITIGGMLFCLHMLDYDYVFSFCVYVFLVCTHLSLKPPDKFRGYQAIHEGHLDVHEDERVVPIPFSPLVLLVSRHTLLPIAGDIDDIS